MLEVSATSACRRPSGLQDLSMAWRKENDSPVVSVFLDVARKTAASMSQDGIYHPDSGHLSDSTSARIWPRL
ncbi:MAG: hypothetical protein R2849_15995 [Thermomicrobiales bacterium]